jgi:hypothetical protein
MAEVKSWKFEDSLGNRILVDDHNIIQTLKFMDSDSVYFEKTLEDDCGNTYGSFMASVQFNTSMGFYNFMIMLGAGGYIEEEYDDFHSCTIDFLVTNFGTSDNDHKNVKYDFVTQKVIEGEGSVEFLQSHQVLDHHYNDVLKITFDWMFSDNDVKVLYYTKRYGIIEFVDGYSNHFKAKD